jgi:hypothetical protein
MRAVIRQEKRKNFRCENGNFAKMNIESFWANHEAPEWAHLYKLSFVERQAASPLHPFGRVTGGAARPSQGRCP